MTTEGRAELERINARQRKATYMAALRQAEADLRAGVEDYGRRLALKRLVRTLRAVMDEGGGTDGLDEGDSH